MQVPAETMDIDEKSVKDVEQELPVIAQTHSLDDGTPNLILEYDQLQRGLKSRHIQFLALGGA